MNEWIDVKDKKPADFDDVLVFAPTGCGVTIAWQESDDSQWYETFTDKPLNPVTHWMPLPDPPTSPERSTSGVELIAEARTALAGQDAASEGAEKINHARRREDA